MTLDQLIEWSLTNEGKAALLAELKNHCPWLYHDTGEQNFSSIQTNGLEPKDPGEGGHVPPRLLALRKAFPVMVSFAPTPNLLPTRLVDDPPLFTLALSSADFSGFFLDWSFPQMFDILEPTIANLGESAVAATVIAKIAGMGGVAFAGAFPAGLLRVKTLTTAKQPPGDWPLIAAAKIEDVSLR